MNIILKRIFIKLRKLYTLDIIYIVLGLHFVEQFIKTKPNEPFFVVDKNAS